VQICDAVVVVTGAANGIGRATAIALAERGAHVVAVDRDGKALADLAARIGCQTIEVDVVDPAYATTVIEQTVARHGRVDAVVANVGVGYVGAFADMPVEVITSLLDINLRAPMLIARAALPGMRAQGTDGALVFTTSIAGVVPVPREAAYCASKTALVSFADSLREELRSTRIAVSTVCPGVVRTAFHATRNEPYNRRWPRPIEPAEVARVIVDVLETGAERRTVPPWLGLAGQARRSAPWLYRRLARRLG
jgi:short-subunit dehydrogenase